MNATPTKLRSGAWGAKVQSEDVREGDAITVTTRAGKSWTATVSKVVWSGKGVSICATASDRSNGSSRSRRYSASYENGIRAPHGRTCPECGDRECAKAWDRHDLCDED